MTRKRHVPKWAWGAGILMILAVLGVGMALILHRAGPADTGTTGVAHGDHTHETEAELWTCSMHPFIVLDEPGDCPVCGMALIPKAVETPAATQDKERGVAYWRAPMNPAEIYDAPGKSAMGMDLVPVYEDELVGGVEIRIDPVVEQNMGVRIQAAERARLARSVHTWGHVTWDETRTYDISPRFSGWIQTLHANFEGQDVKKGDPLFTVYSPELIAAQEEYLHARQRLGGPGSGYNERLLASAKRKLLNYAMAPSEIRRAEKRGRALDTVTITSPYSGVVVDKRAVEGGYFGAGTTLFTVSDLSRVWVEAHVYEYEVARVRAGQQASMVLPFSPGESRTGKVAFVYPFMEGKTRDITVRMEFDNGDAFLKPDMYANVTIETGTGDSGVVIPAESVLRSGSKETVFVRTGKGRYTPREVLTGVTLDDGRLHVLQGVAPGDQVVVSGQFLLDSESQLKEAVAKMMEASNPPPPEARPTEVKDDDFFEDM
ncbi:efflux RND transporter periplasmic adaptor subunit [Desulfoluna spongiiphila]|uniref:Membrane fusion protein, Cu(I)/Ag(I) efflux system/membrane fusion protein, cobalt-zinc-cadmium efflux system n=1 Tax=Desulfoluna spongiiphila TaxID=419481 RepID=A0A1G5I427_9BACT|nr:efflux RND transporter periplasmic adaptor subunit [Desulfoluna spongiiphila]SCY70767.1 membrane fusion protein, Cu(I)/Ag(I) efflux system/membrane fusion protein, cobalt-zinc-cadmium efflux system [Desulfoluna spongiiphila]